MSTRVDPAGTSFGLDPKAIRRSFDAASSRYDQSAVLQKEVRTRLLERLEFIKLQPGVVLDLGAGTGHASRALKSRYRQAQVIALDLAPGMLAEARQQLGWRQRFARLCADAMQLPLQSQSVDLVFSNLMLQWCEPPDVVLAEIRRVLKPGGLFTFTSFGPDTLRELRSAWTVVDDRPHVHRFIDMHDLGDALIRAGLAEPVLDVETFTLTYRSAMTLMRELKEIGATNASKGRGTGLTGKRALRKLEDAYEQFRTQGLLPATYEVVYGQAWGTDNARAQASIGGEIRVPVQSIQKRR